MKNEYLITFDHTICWQIEVNSTDPNEPPTTILIGSISDNPQLNFYMLIYGVTLIGTLVFGALKSGVLMKVI